MSAPLPRISTPARTSPRAGTPLPLDAPGILVVEDDELVRIMLRLGLERHGFRVCLAADSAEAIERYREHAPSIAIVLLDVCMPGLDGPQTLAALRRMNADVVACFMSGNTGRYEPDELLRRGARHVFAKPFLLDELARNLHSLVPTSSTLCPA